MLDRLQSSPALAVLCGGSEIKGRRNIRTEIIEGADHTLSARWARELFATLLEEHLRLDPNPSSAGRAIGSQA